MNKKLIINLVTVVEILVLLGIGSYAWFVDKSSPSISQNNFRVTSAEGLNIKLAADSASRTTINLNELFADFDLFELKQVSSADAINFFTIDFGAGLSYTDPRYVQLLPDAYGEIDMVEYGYIQHTFYLQTEDFGKHVYFHKDTAITGIANDAMRISLSYTIDSQEYNYIFGLEEENAVVGYTTEAVIAEGEFDYASPDSSLLADQLVYTFDSKNGGRGTDDDNPIDLTKTLFTIPANSVLPITIKIWLEGGDEDCDNSLADTALDVNIKFGSANQLLDPPLVSPNNQFLTINGLTTDMEYALTNTIDTVWTRVTRTNVSFTRGQTVYVRIAEVPGVSLASHPAVVVFN